jgi:hypothetical protein
VGYQSTLPKLIREESITWREVPTMKGSVWHGKKLLVAALLAISMCACAGVVWNYVGWTYSCPCGGCESKPHLTMVGHCRACKGMTHSISERHCDNCANAKGVCRHCGEKTRLIRGPLKDPWIE